MNMFGANNFFYRCPRLGWGTKILQDLQSLQGLETPNSILQHSKTQSLFKNRH